MVTRTTVRGAGERLRRALAYAPTTMTGPLTLLLVRHGQSEWNAAGRMQGQTAHVPLTALGHAQAAAAARELAALRPGALISSDLHRAVQTAEHCARATGLPVTTTPALREQGYGVLEGRPSRELWDVVDWTDPHWSAEGGESLAALHTRVAGYLRELRERPPAGVVALVTHGDTIRAAQAVAAGLGPAAIPAVTPHNGTVTRLEL
jgi:broad specificity phosphatase PhoE